MLTVWPRRVFDLPTDMLACAVCSTRAAVQTGRYPHRLGVTDWMPLFQRGGLGTPEKNPTEYVGSKNRKLLCPPNPYWMESSEITLAENLQKNGYKTAYIGKWHLGMKHGIRKNKDTMKILAVVTMDNLRPFLIPTIIQNTAIQPFVLVFTNYLEENRGIFNS